MRLAYRRAGSGPLLVCHPGGPGFSGATLTNLGGLVDSFETVIVDPRGTGASASADTYSQDDYVADLEELRTELGVEQFDLLGHSHGGFVATQYAATHPERVRRLVLAATAPRLAPEYRLAIEAIWDASDDPTIPPARQARAQRLSSSDLERAEIVRLAMVELRLYFARADGMPVLGQVFTGEPPNLDALAYFNRETAPQLDLRPLLSAIRARTLVVTGDRDFFGVPAAQDFAAGIADTRSVVLPDAGHFLWVDQPQAFRSEVAAFLLQ
ncbi:MAG TPA: alpha/beta hydrolase [Gaiellaceae bacterium]|nr:alpha/beta hydrolase [Gaiellaceae bacterium]